MHTTRTDTHSRKRHDRMIRHGMAVLCLALFMIGTISGPARLHAADLPAAATRLAAVEYPGLGLASDPIPFNAEVRTGELANGLRYYLLENRKPEGRAFLRLAVDAGSVLETEAERGLAHFVEHMAFNGTALFPKAELVDYLRSLGMRFGPETNAYTSFDETVYGIEVPVETTGSGGRRLPAKALSVLDQWSRAITFLPEDVDAERAVIQEEYRSGLGAPDRVQRKTLPAILRGSPYAERLPIGLMEVVRTAPAEVLTGFYRKWYRPDNMAVVIVGDFDAAALEAELAAHFTAAKPAVKLSRPRFDLPAASRGAFSLTVATDPELTYGYVHLYYKTAYAPPPSDLGSWRGALVETLIGRMLNVRFQEAASAPETPFAGAGSGPVRYGEKSRYFAFSAIPEPLSAEATLAALLREKESVVRHGFTASELGRAAASLSSAYERALREKDRQESADLADELVSHYLDAEGASGIEWEAKAARVLLPTITVSEAAAAARALFAGNDLTVLLVAPETETAALPTEARIRALVAEAAAADIPAPEEKATTANLAEPPKESGSILSESFDEATGSLVWDLSNGARVILKGTENRNDEVVLYAAARGGEADASDGDAVSASLASGMASASGLGPYPLPELRRMLAGKQASLTFWTGDYLTGFRGSSTTEDLPTLFQLLHLSFAAPRIDEAAAAAYLDRVRTSLAQRKDNPEAVYSDAVLAVVSGGHPRFAPLTVQDLGKASVAAARRFLSSRLDAGAYTFVFAGNVDPAVIKPLVETWLASVPGKRARADWTDLGMKRPAGGETEVRKGTEDKSLVFLGWFAPAGDYSEKEAVAAAALEQYLDIRLTEEIREKRGGVYSASASVGLGVAPRGELSLSVSFSCDPGRADELAAASAAELRLVAEGPVDEDAFMKAVEALRKSHEASLQENTYLASSLANLEVVYGLPIADLASRPALFDELTVGDLRGTAARLLAGGPVRVTLYPEAFAE